MLVLSKGSFDKQKLGHSQANYQSHLDQSYEFDVSLSVLHVYFMLFQYIVNELFLFPIDKTGFYRSIKNHQLRFSLFPLSLRPDVLQHSLPSYAKAQSQMKRN
jgi:hypothetical protein